VKVKEHLQKAKEKEHELDWSFAEWLDLFRNVVTKDELDEMERENSIHSNVGTRSRSNKSIKTANDKNYIPLQGA